MNNLTFALEVLGDLIFLAVSPDEGSVMDLNGKFFMEDLRFPVLR